jgi:hypothetical protein
MESVVGELGELVIGSHTVDAVAWGVRRRALQA